jgi:hypothetical protein
VNFLRQKSGNSTDHVSADEFYEHMPPRRSKYQEGGANLYRQMAAARAESTLRGLFVLPKIIFEKIS